MKKNLGVLAAAMLSLACLCCPAQRIPRMVLPRYPTPEPTSTSGMPFEEFPNCSGNLGQVLEDFENSSPASDEPQVDSEYSLVTYQVDGSDLTDPVYEPVPAELESLQQDGSAQLEIWELFTAIIPPGERGMLTGFNFFTDGPGGTLGAVEQGDSAYDWIMEMDLVDGQNFPDLSTTLIHEFAHLLTLNDSQVVIDESLYNSPDDQDLYARRSASCPNYFTYEGCTKDNSYLNLFFNRFWPDIYPEWQAIDQQADDSTLDRELSDFYQKYADQFVSEYAATDPSEDIAESFMYFIFMPKPAGDESIDRKILFFHEFPELVSLRLTILENLCPYTE